MADQRFPGVEWYCDHCGAHLNGQDGFDDHKYIWKCSQCGFKNSISAANIQTPNYVFAENALLIIDLLRTGVLHIIICYSVFQSFRDLSIGINNYMLYIFALYPILLLARLFIIIYCNYKVGYLSHLLSTITSDVFLPYAEILQVGRSISLLFSAESMPRRIIYFMYVLVCGTIIAYEVYSVYEFCMTRWGSVYGTFEAIKTWTLSLDNVRTLFYPFLFFVSAIQLITFFAFGIDKYYAVKDKWRIKEATLFVFCLLFGAVGGMLGMTTFRHKIKKPAFRILIPILAIVQVIVTVWLVVAYYW